MIRILLLCLLLASPAMAQTAGTVNLVGPSTSPGAPQLTPAAINAAINAALANKQDCCSAGGNLTAPGPIGSVTPNTGAFTSLTTGGLPVPGTISADVTYNIPADYATLPAAFAALAGKSIATNATVTLQMPGGITTAAAPYQLYHPNSNRIIVTGQAPTTTAFTVTGVSGSAGAYAVTGTVASATGIVSGGLVELFAATGCSYASPSTACLHQGAWVVTSVVGTTIIVTNTNWHGGAPPNATVMSMRVYPTTIRWTGSANGIQAYHGYFSNLALRGDNTANAIGFSGYIPNGAATEKDGALTVDHVIANGWDLAGFAGIDKFAATITNSVSSNNGYYGFYFKEGGRARCNTCVASGNGYEDSTEGVSAGFIAKDNSTLNLADPMAVGNRRDGYAATFGMILVENANPPLAGWNDYSFDLYGGKMQMQAWASYGEVHNCILADQGSQFLGRSGVCNTPTVNGVEAVGLSIVDIQSMTLTGVAATTPANGVKAGSGAVVYAQSTNQTTALANAAYLAQDGGSIDNSSASGSVNSTPSTGTVGNNNAFIGQKNTSTAVPNTVGKLTTPGVLSAGTKFTTSGCSVSSTSGGATAGVFTLGANSCTVVVTLNGATGFTATNGWQCVAVDRTAPTVLIGGNSSSNATTASFVIPAGAGATDVIGFACTGY